MRIGSDSFGERQRPFAKATRRYEATSARIRQSDPLRWASNQTAVARSLAQRGESKEAERLFREIVSLYTEKLGPEHTNTLTSRHGLGLVLHNVHRYDEAEVELQSVWKLRERILGPEDRETLKTRNMLASILLVKERYVEAEAAFRTILKIQERVLGPEDSNTLDSRNNLALALLDQGKHREAESEFRTILGIRYRILGPEHPDALGSRHNLAWSLYQQDRNAEAEVELRSLIPIRQRILGPEHPDTLSSRANLARAMKDLGRLEEAEAEYRAVLKLGERSPGRDHPDLLTARNSLGTVLQEQGKNQEAESEYRSVLKARERLLGRDHDDTLRTRRKLAAVLADLERYQEAEQEYRVLLEVNVRLHGPQSRQAVPMLYDVAGSLAKQSKLAEALPYAQRAAEGSKRLLGAEDSDTKSAVELYEQLLSAMESAPILYQHSYAVFKRQEYEQAESLALASAEQAKKEQPLDKESVLKAFHLAGRCALERTNASGALAHLTNALAFADKTERPLEWARVQTEVARALDAINQYPQAEGILPEVISIYSKELGPEHPETLTSRGVLAAVMGKQTKYAEAEAEFRAVLKIQERSLAPNTPTRLAPSLTWRPAWPTKATNLKPSSLPGRPTKVRGICGASLTQPRGSICVPTTDSCPSSDAGRKT